MKTTSCILYLSKYVLVLCFGLLVSCSSDDMTQQAAQLPPSLSDSAWKVNKFVEDNKDQTSRFGSYSFEFKTNGTVIASYAGNTKMGNWSAGSDDSKPKFILQFDIKDDLLEEISEDWHILSATDQRLSLEHISGGDGSKDELIFVK